MGKKRTRSKKTEDTATTSDSMEHVDPATMLREIVDKHNSAVETVLNNYTASEQPEAESRSAIAVPPAAPPPDKGIVKVVRGFSNGQLLFVVDADGVYKDFVIDTTATGGETFRSIVLAALGTSWKITIYSVPGNAASPLVTRLEVNLIAQS
jgi:hypothetical protein